MEIKQLLKEKRFAELKPFLAAMQPADIALVMEDLSEEDQAVFFRILPKEAAAETFVELDSDTQEALITSFTKKELKAVFDEMFVDDTVDIIEEMPANVAKRIIDNADEQTRKEISEILKYPQHSAGSIMTTEYVNLKASMTVLEAFKRIKETGVNKETIYTCYVTDLSRKLLGYVTMRSLVLADSSVQISDIMQKDIVYAVTTEDREVVAKRIVKYGFVALPVVDNEERLVGIITADDVMDVMKEETTEDIHLMHAVGTIEESYLKTSVFMHWRKRILWLIFSMVWGILTGLVILHYENVFAVLPLVVAFIPRLMDTGGDSASQCTAMIIRGMALDEIEKKHFFKAFLKELGVGSLAGLTLAVANIPIMWIMYGAKWAPSQVWYICLAFGLTLFIVVVMSKLLGVILPFFSKLIKIDPALISMPLITNIVDVLSILIYFVIVQWLVLPHFPPLG